MITTSTPDPDWNEADEREANAPRLTDDDLAAIDVEEVMASIPDEALRGPDADASDLRAISQSRALVETANQALDAAVKTARRRGRSWNHIGSRLGLDGPATRARYGVGRGTPVPESDPLDADHR